MIGGTPSTAVALALKVPRPAPMSPQMMTDVPHMDILLPASTRGEALMGSMASSAAASVSVGLSWALRTRRGVMDETPHRSSGAPAPHAMEASSVIAGSSSARTPT